MLKIEKKHKALLNTERMINPETYKDCISKILKELNRIKLIFNKDGNNSDISDLGDKIYSYYGPFGNFEFCYVEIVFDIYKNLIYSNIYFNNGEISSNRKFDTYLNNIVINNKKYNLHKKNIITKYLANQISEEEFIKLYNKELINLYSKKKYSINKYLLDNNIYEKYYFTTEESDIFLYLNQDELFDFFTKNKYCKKKYIFDPFQFLSILDLDFITHPEILKQKEVDNLLQELFSINFCPNFDPDVSVNKFIKQFGLNIELLIFILDQIETYSNELNSYIYKKDNRIEEFLKKLFLFLHKKEIFYLQNIKLINKNDTTKLYYVDSQYSQEDINKKLDYLINRKYIKKLLFKNNFLKHLDNNLFIDSEEMLNNLNEVCISNRMEKIMDYKNYEIYSNILIQAVRKYKKVYIEHFNTIKFLNFFNEINMDIVFYDTEITGEEALSKIVLLDYNYNYSNDENIKEELKNKIFL